MRKTILLLCLIGLFAFLATEINAQQPVSQSERRTVIKALETKIAELEVKRAVDSVKIDPYIIDKQLVNLRNRLAELIGRGRSTVRGQSQKNALIQKSQKTKTRKAT